MPRNRPGTRSRSVEARLNTIELSGRPRDLVLPSGVAGRGPGQAVAGSGRKPVDEQPASASRPSFVRTQGGGWWVGFRTSKRVGLPASNVQALPRIIVRRDDTRWPPETAQKTNVESSQTELGRRIVVEQFAVMDVATHHRYALVPGLPHDGTPLAACVAKPERRECPASGAESKPARAACV